MKFNRKMLETSGILTLSLGNPMIKRKKKNTLSGASSSTTGVRRHVSRPYVGTSRNEMRKSGQLARKRTTRTSGTKRESLAARIFFNRPCARRTPFLLVREEGLSTIGAAVHRRGSVESEWPRKRILCVYLTAIVGDVRLLR